MLLTALAVQLMTEMVTQLGMKTIEMAHAIVDIANENMANAIRMVSIERGHDPRRFALLAFGGAGPLHGAAIARKLDIPTVIVPPFPGAFSAMGLLMADLRVDKIWTQAFRSDKVTADLVQSQFQQIADAALTELRQQGYTGEPQLRYAINMRYLGQNYETEIEQPALVRDKAQLDATYEAFHQMHAATYGYRIPGAVVELISFKVTAVGVIPKPRLATVQTVSSEAPRERSVYFAGHGFVPCRIVRRRALPIGEWLAGPLIIEEEGSTTLVEPGMHIVHNEYDVLVLTIGNQESSRNL